MKHLLLALLCFATTATLTANAVVDSTSANANKGPSRDTKIFYILKENGYAIEKDGKIVGLKEKFQIGDKLEFQNLFSDGFDTTYTATKGDNPWVVTGKLIDYLEPIHGSMATIPLPVVEKATASTLFLAAIRDFLMANTWLFWLLGALLLVSAIFATRKWWRKFNDPVGGGRPFLRHGVDNTSSEAIVTAANQVAGRIGATRIVGQIHRGFLNGIKRVRYENNRRGALRIFRNEPGYQAVAEFANGERRTVQFLQGCGNDVVYGDRWYEGLQFTPQGEAIEIPAPASSAQSVTTTPTTTLTTDQILERLPDVVVELQKGLKGNMTISNGDVTITINTENNQLLTNNHKPEVAAADTTQKN